MDILSRRLTGFRRSGGAWYKALCPFHKENDPSFYVNLESGGFYCHGCHEGGGPRTLLKRLGYDYGDLDALIKRLQLGLPYRHPEELGKTPILPDYILGAYEKCPKDLLDDGFDKDLLWAHEIGFDSERYRITFPIRDVDGNLVGISGRTVEDEEPRYLIYKFEKEFPDYVARTHDYLWREDKFMAREDSSSPVDTIVLCEGFKAALWVVQSGYFSLALIGSRLFGNKRPRRGSPPSWRQTRYGQLKKLEQFYASVILFLDNDPAGARGTDQAVSHLLPILPSLTAVDYLDDRAQPDDYTHEEIGEMLDNSVSPSEWKDNLIKKGHEEWIT